MVPVQIVKVKKQSSGGGVSKMGKFTFVKFLAVLTCFVAGSLLAGLAVAGMDIGNKAGGDTFALGIPGQKGDRSGDSAHKVVIALVGDVLLAGSVGDAINVKGPDYPWRETADLLRESDIAVANLECAVSNRGTPEPDKEFTFRADPKVLNGAANAGVDVLTLANNHVLDFGREAMLDTINLIKEQNIGCTGAGTNEDEASTPAVLVSKGKKVAVLAFTRIIPRSDWIAGSDSPGLASGHNYQQIMDRVKASEKEADISVVSMHWGYETEDIPDRNEIQLARALVDAGADIVVGHHPHVLQGIEIYKGRIIAYSLGNFIFTTPYQPKAGEGAILQVTAGPGGEYNARIIPTLISNGAARVLKGSDRQRVLDRVNQLSGEFKTSVDNKGEISGLQQ